MQSSQIDYFYKPADCPSWVAGAMYRRVELKLSLLFSPPPRRSVTLVMSTGGSRCMEMCSVPQPILSSSLHSSALAISSPLWPLAASSSSWLDTSTCSKSSLANGQVNKKDYIDLWVNESIVMPMTMKKSQWVNCTLHVESTHRYFAILFYNVLFWGNTWRARTAITAITVTLFGAA